MQKLLDKGFDVSGIDIANNKWSRALDFRGPKLCPSCGRDTIMYNLPNDADELLRELDRMDDV